MRTSIGNTLRIAAATTAIAGGVPAVANAETAPTNAAVVRTLQRDYRQLTSSAEHLGFRHGVKPSAIGNVGIKASLAVFGGGETGNVIDIQSDAYDKSTRTLSETDIEIYAPDSQKTSGAIVPSSLFHITLLRAKNNHENAPKTPAGFKKAVVSATGKYTLSKYDFYIGIPPEDTDWQVVASHRGDRTEQVFSTATSGPLSAPKYSATQNFDAVKALISQGELVLGAAERHRTLSKGVPADLGAAHPR